MLGQTIDRIEARLAPWSTAISVLAGVWFWLGIAIYAGFIRLPDWLGLPERALFWAGVTVNAVWWGFLRPAIERRRARKAAANPV